MPEEKLIWPNPGAEYIESPVKINIPELAEKWYQQDPDYPEATHKLNSYVTMLRNKSVKKDWVVKRKIFQRKLNRVKDLLPKQKALLEEASKINQKHFDALERALSGYNLKFEKVMLKMETNPLALTPQDLKQLTSAMLDIQKGQRLAAGMLTDRIGVVNVEEIKAIFKQITSIFIFVFDTGKVKPEVRETAMKRLEAAIDIGDRK